MERTVEIKIASERELFGMQKVHERQQLCGEKELAAVREPLEQTTHP